MVYKVNPVCVSTGNRIQRAPRLRCRPLPTVMSTNERRVTLRVTRGPRDYAGEIGLKFLTVPDSIMR